MSVMKILAVTLLVCTMVVLNGAQRPIVCPPGPPGPGVGLDLMETIAGPPAISGFPGSRVAVCPPGPPRPPGPPGPRVGLDLMESPIGIAGPPGPPALHGLPGGRPLPLTCSGPKSRLFKRDQGCPNGWYPRGNRCFLLVKAAKNWHEAERHCWSMGARLASVHDDDVSNFLKWLVETYGKNTISSAWLGASDTIQVGVWRWTDGTRFEYEPNSFTKNSGWGDCLRMTLNPNPYWDAIKCTYALPSICAK